VADHGKLKPLLCQFAKVPLENRGQNASIESPWACWQLRFPIPTSIVMEADPRRERGEQLWVLTA
jgi:hypothetical protein